MYSASATYLLSWQVSFLPLLLKTDYIQQLIKFLRTFFFLEYLGVRGIFGVVIPQSGGRGIFRLQ